MEGARCPDGQLGPLPDGQQVSLPNGQQESLTDGQQGFLADEQQGSLRPGGLVLNPSPPGHPRGLADKLGLRLGLQAHLSAAIALVVLVSIALISLLAHIFINAEFEKRAQNQQASYTEGLVSQFSNQYHGSGDAWNLDYVHGVGMSALAQGYLISLYDSEGMVVWDAESHDMTLCGQVMAEISRRMEVERPSLAGEFVTHEYELGDPGHSIGRLVVKSYGPYFLTENDFDFLHTLNLILLTIGLLALILAVLAGSWLARRLVRPLAATAHGATAISGGDYRIRLVRKSNIRELDELAQAVNHLAYSLGQQEGLRQRLTTDVAHELRTPLSAIASHLEMMMEGIWEPSPERLQSCYEEIARLSNLVSDLENLASIENGNLALHRAPLDLLALAHSVSANFESECAQKGIALKVEGSPAVVNADKGRLTQVLTNLLSNALKYTPAEGHIHLQVEDTPESGVVVVADDGIGIPQEDLPLVFERFYRTDASRARATGGGGIGLAIARSIVAAHGGTITAESGTAPPIHRGTGADAGTGREQTAAPGDTQAEGKADQEQRTPPTGAVAPGSRFIITLPKGSYPG